MTLGLLFKKNRYSAIGGTVGTNGPNGIWISASFLTFLIFICIF